MHQSREWVCAILAVCLRTEAVENCQLAQCGDLENGAGIVKRSTPVARGSVKLAVRGLDKACSRPQSIIATSFFAEGVERSQLAGGRDFEDRTAGTAAVADPSNIGCPVEIPVGG